MLLRLRLGDVDATEVVADPAHHPGQIVVSVDDRDRATGPSSRTRGRPRPGTTLQGCDRGQAGRDERRAPNASPPTPFGASGSRLALVVALLAGSCTYSSSEPGLFRTEAPVEEFSDPPLPLEPTNPKLPVAGETVWTSSEGLRVTARFAVHAVRTDGRRDRPGLVGDPAVGAGPGAGRADPVVGRSRPEPGHRWRRQRAPDRLRWPARSYRPLQHRSRREFNRCLCTPLWVSQLELRIGETRLLQATLPDAAGEHPLRRRGDVDPAGVRARPGGAQGSGADGARPDGSVREPPDEPSPLAPPYHVSEPNVRGPTARAEHPDRRHRGRRPPRPRCGGRSAPSPISRASPCSRRARRSPPKLPPDVELFNASAASGPQLQAGEDDPRRPVDHDQGAGA